MVKYGVLHHNMKKIHMIISQLFDIMLVIIPFIYLLPIDVLTKLCISVYLVYAPCIIYKLYMSRKKKIIIIQKKTRIKKQVHKEEMEYLMS